ncbi:MAG: hypothetical protein IMZ53_16625 [Thermoplasmata archaeon]|nr:hypothetical protein [Thermoplasmata archaeon]MBE3142199.1 hypothetical protein [Thermoplasmata archaeon]
MRQSLNIHFTITTVCPTLVGLIGWDARMGMTVADRPTFHLSIGGINQGAESTIAFLLPLYEMTNITNIIETFKEPILE